MGFLQAVQKDLQQSLAEQQHIALLHVLRERSATITFDDIRQLLASPLGKRLGPVRVADVIGVAPAPAPKAASKPPKAAAQRKPRKKAARPKRRAAKAPSEKEQGGASAAVNEPVAPAASKKRTRTGKKAARAKAPTTKRSSVAKAPRPPGMSPEQAAQLASYTEQVHAHLNASGDWIGASELRDHVGGTGDQLRLALKKLESRGSIVRTGERINTRYKIAQK